MKTLRSSLFLAIVMATFIWSGCEKETIDTIKSNGPSLDLDLFEQNIIDALDGNTVGFSYAINHKGRLYAEDGLGWAVRPADSRDGNGVSMTADKRMTIASLSKPITAVMALQVFDDNNVSIDEPISNYLPGGWNIGPWTGNIMIEHLFRHRTGFHSGSNSYAVVKSNFEKGVDKDSIGVFDYENVNYATFRVLLPHLIDGATLGQLSHEDDKLEPLCFETFYNYLKDDFLPPMEVNNAAIEAEAINPTRFYNFNDNQSGWLTPRYEDLGAVGLYLSAHEIAAFLAYMNHDNSIISQETRDLMYDKQLALRSTTGLNGTYFSHGGDWWDGGGSTNGRGFTGEMMVFPDTQVEAVIMVNCRGGNHSNLTTVLRNAYDNAWVEN